MPTKPTKAPAPKRPPAKLKPHTSTPREPMRFALGDVLRCRITGLEGVAVAFSEYLYGCRRWAIQPPINDAKKMEWAWLDEPQAEHVASAPAATPAAPARATGGPRPDAPAR